MASETEWNDTTTGAAAQDEWHDVDTEFQIAFEQIGDGFIGRYMGMDPPNANGIVQAHFTNVTDLDGNPIADRAFLNATRDQQGKFRTIPVKAMVRDIWTSNLNTGHESGNPMRVHTVQWK